MSYNTYPQNPFPPNSENAGGGSFTLPIASTTQLGGVKVGSGLSINAETGALSLANDVIKQDDIALPFDANSAYLAGDFCYYNGTLYRCETDHSGAWDANDFFAVRVCDSIISEFGDGLQRMSNEVYVKLKSDGGLHFDGNGAIYADHLPDYSLTEHKTGRQWIDGRDVYTRVFQYENSLQLPSNTWVNSGTIGDIDKCISCVALSDDGTCIPVCAYYDSSVGLQFLSMRSLTVSPTNFILNYLKATPQNS